MKLNRKVKYFGVVLSLGMTVFIGYVGSVCDRYQKAFDEIEVYFLEKAAEEELKRRKKAAKKK